MKKLFHIGMIVLILASCKSKSAFNFNQDLVNKENSMIPVIRVEEASVTNSFESGNYDSMAAASIRLEDFVQTKISEIEDMKTPSAKEADNFKRSYINSFKSLKQIYTQYKDIAIAKTEEERNTLLEELPKLVDEKKASLKDMQSAQRKYASANGFRIQ